MTNNRVSAVQQRRYAAFVVVSFTEATEARQ